MLNTSTSWYVKDNGFPDQLARQFLTATEVSYWIPETVPLVIMTWQRVCSGELKKRHWWLDSIQIQLLMAQLTLSSKIGRLNPINHNTKPSLEFLTVIICLEKRIQHFSTIDFSPITANATF